MQKFTIFTIIFSVLVITVTAELVVQDYLQKLYPDPATLQSNTLNATNFDDFVNTTDATNIKSRVEELLEDQPEAKPSAEDTNENEVETPAKAEVKGKISTLLPALNIDGITYKESVYSGMLFQLIDTKKMPIVSSEYGLFTAKNATVGSTYLFKAKNELEAEEVFANIKKSAETYPEITVNQTNQFGEKSFYINHIVKVGEVFIVFQKDTYVYAFAYKKEFHNSFKEFFEVMN